ncbi:F-box/kelch-repeat protein At3g23880-like [Lotus japonicus]|uniref:F-box/kelch-repeat protein At3g23880-like n=1 Tax=Lotus japonicus TaxID=34305 RepID=UPI00258304A4|nr:F-box/kelch-repeat protein At3g23880-like [Lotus japonicus]
MEGRHNNFISSINGLVCLRENKCFRVWNPSIRLTSKRSPAFSEEMLWIPYNAFFGYDKVNPYNAFFGYDKVNDKYKVLTFGRVGRGRNIRHMTRLYTFGESYWTTIQDLPFDPNNLCECQIFVNGNLHWLTNRRDGSLKLVIISFDVEKETYGEVLLPPKLDGKIRDLDLHVSNNYLYVWQFSHKSNYVLWLMKEYGVQESWTKLMIIPRKSFHISRSHICGYSDPLLSPLCILGNGVVVLRTTCSRSYLVMYVSKNGKFGCYCRITRSSHPWCGGIHHESLVSPPYVST